MWFLIFSRTKVSQSWSSMQLNYSRKKLVKKNGVRLLLHGFLIGSWEQFICHNKPSSCYFLPVGSGYLGGFILQTCQAFFSSVIFHLSVSHARSLSPFTLASVFLVTVCPVEGSGNTNRLSLPCGFPSSFHPSLHLLSSLVPRVPSSFCVPHFKVSSSLFLRRVGRAHFLTASSAHFLLTSLSLSTSSPPPPLHLLPLKPQEPVLPSLEYHHCPRVVNRQHCGSTQQKLPSVLNPS